MDWRDVFRLSFIIFITFICAAICTSFVMILDNNLNKDRQHIYIDSGHKTNGDGNANK